MQHALAPYWVRLVYPLVGAVIGVWVASGWGLLFPLVLMIILFGVFFTRAILVMLHARWDHLCRIEFDWLTGVLAFTVTAAMSDEIELFSHLITWCLVWIAGALVMFWITFVARAIEK